METLTKRGFCTMLEAVSGRSRQSRQTRPFTCCSVAVCILILFFTSDVCSMSERDRLSMSIDEKVNVVVVFNSDPLDSTTFTSYMEFAAGLSLQYPDARFSLLTFSVVEGRFMVNFGPTTGKNISFDMWRSRPGDDMASREAYRLLDDPKVIVSLGVDVSENVPMCRKTNETINRYSYAHGIVLRKCYQLSLQTERDVQESDICRNKKIIQYSTLQNLFHSQSYQIMCKSTNMIFCTIAQFYTNFKFIYEDLDEPDVVTDYGSASCVYDLGICYDALYLFGMADNEAYQLHDQYNEKNKWSLVIVGKKDVGRSPLITWYEARSLCSTLGLSLLTVHNERQLNVLYDLLEARFKLGLADDELQFPIKLTRSNRKAGQRFVYNDNKDLMSAAWRHGEPKGYRWRKCVGHFAEGALRRYGSSRKKYGWFASSCAKRKFNSVICHSDTPPNPSALILSPESKAMENKVISEEGLETVNILDDNVTGAISRTYKEALSVIRGEGRLQILLDDEVTEATTTSNGQVLFTKTQLLFHKCFSGKPSGHSIIPVVNICDGKADCPSGSDESFCGSHGIAACSSKEWMCSSRQCVPIEARCDLIQDCQDGSDEKECGSKCQHGVCGNGRCLPKPWFNDGQRDCRDGDDEPLQLTPTETCVFLCNRTQCVTRSMLNDSVVDCQGPEGPLDETLGAFESINCTGDRGLPVVNNWAPRCVLARDMFGEIIGCRYFQHLRDCENFKCPPGYVKCPDSFCVPLSYVADGKEDCYEGEDEVSPILYDRDMTVYQCQQSGKQMVALSAVCDGRNDCSQGEDELDCEISCFPGFFCIAGVVLVTTNYNRSLPLIDLSFIDDRIRYLDLSGVNVNNFFYTFPPDHLAHLLILKLSNCNIINVGFHGKRSACRKAHSARDFQTVQSLDLSYNQIKQLASCSYLRPMHGLIYLNMSHNYLLAELYKTSLHNYFELKTLDLSFTALKSIDKDQFKGLFRLETLYLQHSKLTSLDFAVSSNVQVFNVEGLDIEHVGRDTLGNVSFIKEIHSPTYKLCCPQVIGYKKHSYICHFPPGDHVSCADLMEEVFLRSMLWLVSLSIIGGNTATLIYRLGWEAQILHKPFGLYVTNLGVSDLLMGVYLMIIGIEDAITEGEYVLHDFTWRNNPICWTAGSIATLSSLTSSLFLLLITMERYLAVRFPFGDVRLSTRTITIAVISVWLFGATVTIIPFLPFAQNWVIFSSNGMCIGLPLESKRLPGWQFSAAVFVAFNLLIFTSIGLGQAAIFKTITKKGKRVRKTSSRNSQRRASQRMQEFAIAKQLSIVVLTDFMCLVPVVSMGLVVMFGHDIDQAAYRWTAVIIVPINSALNPLLYTLPTIKAKWLNYLNERKKAKEAAREEAYRLKILRGEGPTGKQSRRQQLMRLGPNFRRLVKLKRTLRYRVQAGRVGKRGLEILGSRVAAITTICGELLK